MTEELREQCLRDINDLMHEKYADLTAAEVVIVLSDLTLNVAAALQRATEHQHNQEEIEHFLKQSTGQQISSWEKPTLIWDFNENPKLPTCTQCNSELKPVFVEEDENKIITQCTNPNCRKHHIIRVINYE